MAGNPNSSNLSKQAPYIRVQINGTNVDSQRRPTGGKTDPASIMSPAEFIFERVFGKSN